MTDKTPDKKAPRQLQPIAKSRPKTMMRVFVERKIKRQIVHRSLLISLAAFLLMLPLWFTDVLPALSQPVRMFVNNIHGGFTAFAMQISSGTVQSFTLAPDGSYTISFSGGADALTMSAGYLGSALFGAFMFFLVNRAPQLARGLSIVTGLFTIGFLALFIRPDETGDLVSMVICLGFGAVLVLLGWTGKGDINKFLSRRSLTQIVITLVSLMTACHILLDLPLILRTPARIDGAITNPVAYLSETVFTGFSVPFIAFSWAGIALVLLGIAFYFSIIKPLRQIPVNDDIV